LRLRWLFCVALGLAPAAQAQSLSGTARAVDGDSLVLADTRIRLMGIDAPEGRQSCTKAGAAWACGAEAAALLTHMVADQTVRCEGQGRDPYGRLVAVCRAGEQDLARAMVEAGLAVILPNGVQAYGALEAQVRKLGWGLWGGSFEQPSHWRAAHKAQEASEAAPRPPAQPTEPAYRNAAGCMIKGNHSWHGDWIYHLPGTQHYAETRAEAWFCTESQALAAGYRAARNR